MHILNLIPHLSGGGAERQLSYLSPALSKIGHHISIAFSEFGPERLQLSDVDLHLLKCRSNYNPNLIWKIIHLVSKIKPDVIHTWNLKMDILGGIAALVFQIPWVLSEQSSAMCYPWSLKHFLRLNIGSKANAIISNSRGGDAYWKAHFPRLKRFIVPNGLPLDEINKIIPRLPPGILDTQRPILLYVGRLNADTSANKNLKLLLKTIAYVNDHINVMCVLCGQGPQRRELELLRHDLDLDHVVYFTGFLNADSIWAFMKTSPIFISLSAFEGSPNTVMEAMACGCPLVISDIPAHREILDDSSAFFVDPYDTRHTAKIILDLISNKISYNGYTKNAEKRTQQWSISKMSKNYETIYKEICAKA